MCFDQRRNGCDITHSCDPRMERSEECKYFKRNPKDYGCVFRCGGQCTNEKAIVEALEEEFADFKERKKNGR